MDKSKEFKEKIEKINPNIVVLGQYVRSHDKIRCYCKVCNKEFERQAKELSNIEKGCPECGKKRTAEKRKEQGKQKFLKFLGGGTTIMVGPYEGRDYHTLFRCTKCGYEWNTSPSSFYSNKNNCMCPRCKGQNNSLRCRKDNNTFIKEIQKINPDIEILEEYTTSDTKIRYRCKKCEYVGESTPNHLLRGHGCPQCNISIGENIIRTLLVKNKINYIPQYKINIDPSINSTGKAAIDFYLPDLNIAIEYNGIQHYKYNPYFHKGGMIDFEHQQKRDKHVRNYCKENNIQLIEIDYSNNTINSIKSYLTFL